MKNTLIGSIGVVVLLAVIVAVQSIRLNRLDRKYSDAVQNNKAYESQMEILRDENKAFVFDIDQLKYMNDSTVRQLDSMRRELGIKDRKIKQMGKIREYVYITDTMKIHDTIFSDPGFVMDTCLGDKWYDNCIHMEYPNTISSSVSITTDQNCFLHVARETIDPPRKTWLGRLF